MTTRSWCRCRRRSGCPGWGRGVPGRGGYVADEPIDLASCVGATGIGGGVADTDEVLRRSLRPAGLMLIGEPYWRQAPPTQDVIEGCHTGSRADSPKRELVIQSAPHAVRASAQRCTRHPRPGRQAAQRLGADSNEQWTAFGLTNVAIHTVATASELGDHQIAAELGRRVDTSGLPAERQVRHHLEQDAIPLVWPVRVPTARPWAKPTLRVVAIAQPWIDSEALCSKDATGTRTLAAFNPFG